MQTAVTISLVPEARGGPFVFWEDLAAGCARAAALGFAAVEVFPRSAEDLDARQLRRCLTEHHLKLAAVGTGAGWVVHKLRLTDPDPAVRGRARQFIAALIDFAGAFGAPAIIGSMQGRHESGVTRPQALGWLAEALEQLGPRAHAHGVPLLFEPLNRYETNLINTVADGLELLRPLRTRNVKLLCDLFHMNIEEASIPEALRRAGATVGHVHLADSNRRAAGLGHTDFGPVIQALREAGYDGYLSAEVLPLPDSETAARQTIAFARDLGSAFTAGASADRAD
ncbi:MAG TPA: sugar phosphate isomerase/epimerase family protein [Methylomirabilota bacterium]|nr:sugar phosphate isomerase/epimerase family protein [Methylomirabilota bacterium]